MTDWLSLARNRPCIACGADDGTIVPCHSNQQAHGKGRGIKAADFSCFPGCAKCHFAFDHTMTRDEARAFWQNCWVAHMMSLCAAGLIAPVGMKERERRPAKVLKLLPRTKPSWGPEAA